MQILTSVPLHETRTRWLDVHAPGWSLATRTETIPGPMFDIERTKWYVNIPQERIATIYIIKFG